MSNIAAGAASGKGGTRWGAVALGWVLAVLTGIVTGTILRQAYGLLAEPPVEGGELSATVVVISVVSGFLSYLVGGYAAARMARYSCGRHGALTAVFGLIVGVILAIVLVFVGTLFAEGLAALAVPPSSFGPIGAAWAAGGLILFLVNLFAGFVGGKLGEPSNRS